MRAKKQNTEEDEARRPCVCRNLADDAAQNHNACECCAQAELQCVLPLPTQKHIKADDETRRCCQLKQTRRCCNKHCANAQVPVHRQADDAAKPLCLHNTTPILTQSIAPTQKHICRCKDMLPTQKQADADANAVHFLRRH